MRFISHSRKALLIAALLAGTATGLNAQVQDPAEAGVTGSVTDTSVPDPASMTKGPEIEGIISARSGDRMQVTAQDGTKSVVTINGATKIKAAGGFLNLNRSKLAATSLLNGSQQQQDSLPS